MPTKKITALLQAWSQGDAEARDQLAALVYRDLRRVAGARLRGRATPTFSPTDLVHDAYVRLLGQQPRFANRIHFFAVAAEMMHRVLVDHARARGAQKRGGAALRVNLSDAEADVAQGPKSVDVLALDRALEELAAQDPEWARLVRLRFYAEMSYDELAKVLEISPSAAKRGWALARGWLNRRLASDRPPAAP